jgi:membrane protease YdiL (CAAX protease family)
VIAGLRPIDALVAWIFNAGVPLFGGLLWLIATRTPGGSATFIVLRLLGTGLIVIWIVRRRGLDLKAIVDSFRTSKGPLLIGCAAGLGLFIVEYLAFVLWNFLSRVPNLGDGTWNPWVTVEPIAGPYTSYFLALAVVGPVIEEFVHRGVAWSALQGRFGLRSAMLATSVVFALGHPFGHYGSRILAAFLAGLLYVWLAARYRSLGPPWAAHLTMNLMVFLAGWAGYNFFGLPGLLLS